MNVKYLINIDSKQSFCSGIDSFNNLIQSYDDIKINDNEITYSGKKFEYDIKLIDSSVERQRLFLLSVSLKSDEDEEQFKAMLRLIRTIIDTVTGRPPEVLWDGVASKLCERAYPHLYYTENLLRRLITQFMYTKVGIGWVKSTVPDEVDGTIRSKNSNKTGQKKDPKNKKREVNYLHQLDFIQLANFLFNKYTKYNVVTDLTTLTDNLKKGDEQFDKYIKEVKRLLPSSNWERYFEPLVNCEGDFLEGRWERLYELRCEVAHNKFITSNDLNEIEKITREVNEKFHDALEKMSDVEISESERTDVVENIVSMSNPNVGKLLDRWNVFQSDVQEITSPTALNFDIDPKDMNGMVDSLVNTPYFNDAFKEKYLSIYNFKESILGNANFEFNDSDLERLKVSIEELIDELGETREAIAISYSRARDNLYAT
ncbi:hypothetical protein J7G27_003030 [Vibrio vulnificus]|uniref:HEPN domain-containing protein n=2 Tax=Vibrio TaxID=662 RepID=UPI00102A2570|nr:HEPN domain-containing protein [Vibrio vulnificus]EHH1226748.1 hypothetical protein [Vibrio vulnificus]ELX4133048.1 hypothetical protein [Vibrio vulnificus]ELX4178097.1 hypothetical protein [Vibrio vulnificus]MDK2638742.1 HEPN domain-containing protein [Vibrio vulnificus]MDK2647099.1 HEPN domain-containing protein [Vibrio vulnificus]